MDGSIGQAAFDQAAAFRSAVDVGAVILTKMDGHARGGGALAAVAATAAPIAFIGTGEHLDELERFEPKSFVGRLLGRGDWRGFVDRVADAVPPGAEAGMEAVLGQIQAGNFTLRIMYDQFAALQRMGPLNQVMGLIPGLGGLMGGGAGGGEGVPDAKASALRLRRMMTIMDSMTPEVCRVCVGLG
jgi:signal recognition particle subunit SRP54